MRARRLADFRHAMRKERVEFTHLPSSACVMKRPNRLSQVLPSTHARPSGVASGVAAPSALASDAPDAVLSCRGLLVRSRVGILCVTRASADGLTARSDARRGRSSKPRRLIAQNKKSVWSVLTALQVHRRILEGEKKRGMRGPATRRVRFGDAERASG